MTLEFSAKHVAIRQTFYCATKQELEKDTWPCYTSRMQKTNESSSLKAQYVSPIEGERISPFSRWQLRGWAYSGVISSVKIGGPKGRLLIPIGEIERILVEGTRPARTESTTAA